MNVLLLVPMILEAEAPGECRPRMDNYAIADALRACPKHHVDLLDYRFVERDPHWLVQVARRSVGRDVALALLGFLRRRQYDAIYTNSESVGIPLALLLKGRHHRPGHVTVGHQLSSLKKRPFFRVMQVQKEMDTIFVYAQSQLAYAQEHLGIREDGLQLIAFTVDHHFFKPDPMTTVNEHQICSVGLEHRDFSTLFAAVEELPALRVHLTGFSPWTRRADPALSRRLPANVHIRRYDYDGLRRLYAESCCVVLPLYESDYAAGLTTLLEAMAMGKAVIVTRTAGLKGLIVDGVNGLTVAPGDVAGWITAIQRVQGDRLLRERLGEAARKWIEEQATMDRWVDHIVVALRRSCRKPAG